MTTEDARRAQYVPINSNLAFGKTAARLKKKYGRDGLLVWMLSLAAAKRSREQGVFTYTSEAEGWQLLGLDDDPPAFSLDEFFAYTGRGRSTRIVRLGSTRHVFYINWKSWNDQFKKQQQSERMSRKRGGNTRTSHARSAHVTGTEGEVEGEVTPYPLSVEKRKALEFFVRAVGHGYTDDVLADELRQQGVMAEDIEQLLALAAEVRAAHEPNGIKQPTRLDEDADSQTTAEHATVTPT